MEKTKEEKSPVGIKPAFLRTKTRLGPETNLLRSRLRRFQLNTVCEQAHCPNLGECFGKSTSAFIILGRVCTRNCRFCAVEKGKPIAPDPQEPIHLAEMAKELGLKHIVITSVSRDDLPDFGAEQFYQSVRAVKNLLPASTVEVLTPDFQGRLESVARVAEARPEVYNHNLETVPGLYPEVRPQADYQRSLSILKWVAENAKQITTKSGIMVGLGETRDEIIQVMQALREIGCQILTIGQYLAPSRKHWPVARYYQPEEYEELEQIGINLGFEAVSAGPLVRSSFCAEEILNNITDYRRATEVARTERNRG